MTLRSIIENWFLIPVFVPVCGYFLLMIWRLLGWLDWLCLAKKSRQYLKVSFAIVVALTVVFRFKANFANAPPPSDEFYLFN